MRNLISFLVIIFLYFSANAKDFIQNAKLIGQGSLYYFIWHVYDVSLYSENSFSSDKPFFLTFNYKRKLYGKKIADRSAKEIRKLGFKDEVKLAGWHSQMRDIFPDVKDGSLLTGLYKQDKSTVFYNDKSRIGIIKDPEFGKWFFGIWLNKNTSEPKLRKALLGGVNV